MNSEKEIKWYLVYDELAEKLFEYFRKNTKLSPVFLFNRLKDHKEFIDANQWFQKFIDDDNVASGLDPIHLFSSINGNSLKEESRIDRIQILLKVFGSNLKVNGIDFTGCPAPPVIKQSSIRSLGMQEQIWNFFALIYLNGNSTLRIEEFELYKGWYGIEFASLTTFVFWVRSDNFIPLDKNTRQYLQISHFLPQNFNIQDYFSLVRKIDEHNYNSETWGDKAIYREIAYASYALINSKTQVKISSNLQDFFGIKNESEFNETSLSVDFKMIAIKFLDECDKEHLNVLKNNTENIYYFEKAFKIEKKYIRYDSSKDIQLYNIEHPNNLNVNVTAIVGKNGSGKSSLIELLAKTINNITYPFKDSLNTEELILEENLATELYYKVGDKIIRLQVINKETKVFEYLLEKGKKDDNGRSFFNLLRGGRSFSRTDFYSFFYTICINYSHYALNSRHLGPWIEKLFHKNDSYQAPIVFNPMRTEGDIHINTENELAKSRLVANLFDPVEEGDLGIRQLTDSQKVLKINFQLDKEKNTRFFKEVQEQVKANDLGVYYEIEKYIEIVYEVFSIKTEKIGQLEKETIKYIFRKLIRIWETYPHYKKKFDLGSPRSLNINIKEWEAYVKKIVNDSSHIVYKLKQAINYLKYTPLLPKELDFDLELDYLNIEVEKLARKNSELEKIELIELLPPPIFKTEIVVIDDLGNISDFNKLSSGEKQQIHAINSIIYHIKNLNSIESNDTDLVNYTSINLILDEIELYYHPELQRKYLSYLLKTLGKIYLENIDSINICLITHSPYILSDIPEFYTLRLNDGKPKDSENQTFGANIYDLMADGFFMNDGFIGEYAKDKIEELFGELYELKSNSSYKISSEKYSELQKKIDIVGERIIKTRLNDLLNDISKEETLIKKEIELAEKHLIELKGKLDRDAEN